MTNTRTVVRIEGPEQIDEWNFIQRMMRMEMSPENVDVVEVSPTDFQRLVLWAVRDWNARNPCTQEQEAVEP